MFSVINAIGFSPHSFYKIINFFSLKAPRLRAITDMIEKIGWVIAHYHNKRDEKIV